MSNMAGDEMKRFKKVSINEIYVIFLFAVLASCKVVGAIVV